MVTLQAKMGNNSEKKIARARLEASRFYLPFWIAVEALHMLVYFLYPLVVSSSSYGGDLTVWNVVKSLSLTAMSATAYLAILSAADESVSGGASSDKWSKDDDSSSTSTTGGKKGKKVPGSSSIDAFFLSLLVKSLTLLTETAWYGAGAVVPIFFAWKAYTIYSLVRGGMNLFTGGAAKKKEVASSETIEETKEERERREKRAEKRRSKSGH